MSAASRAWVAGKWGLLLIASDLPYKYVPCPEHLYANRCLPTGNLQVSVVRHEAPTSLLLCRRRHGGVQALPGGLLPLQVLH